MAAFTKTQARKVHHLSTLPWLFHQKFLSTVLFIYLKNRLIVKRRDKNCRPCPIAHVIPRWCLHRKVLGQCARRYDRTTAARARPVRAAGGGLH